MGYFEKNCSNCDNYFGDQCSKCAAEEAEERRNATCDESNGRVLQRECGLKSVHAKLDECSKCGYRFVYP